MCKLADTFKDRSAVASAIIAHYDGKKLTIVKNELHGSIAHKPLGDSGFGWNIIFIPKGQPLTLGQMDELTFERYYRQVKPFDKIRTLLDKR